MEAVVGVAGLADGVDWLGGGDDEPPNQPANGFQPPDCFGVAGTGGLASLPQPCSVDAVRVGAGEAPGMAAGATAPPPSASPASW